MPIDAEQVTGDPNDAGSQLLTKKEKQEMAARQRQKKIKKGKE